MGTLTLIHNVPPGTPTRQQHHLDTAIALTFLAFMFTCLRFYARFKRGVGIGWDDYTLVLALVFLIGCMICQCFMLHYGMGLHANVLSQYQIAQMLKTLVAYECIYSTTVGIVKISLLLMYGRIFTISAFRKASYALATIVVGWTISINAVSIFQCTPMRKAWEPMTPGHCIHVKAFFFGNAIPNILTDLAMLCLPMPIVWGLHSSLTHKLSLSVVFSLGAFTIFASTYRFTTLFQFQPLDPSWTLADSTTWSLIEGAAGIISACLPTLRPLLKMATAAFGSTQEDSSPYANNQPPTIGSSPTNNHLRTLMIRSGVAKSTANASVIEAGPAEIGKDTWCRGEGGSEEWKSDLESGRYEEHGDEVPLHRIRVDTETEISWAQPGTAVTRGAGRE